ncbi:MAG: T9SS type B sorting domain-containing protein [Sphingobacteriales bacterium]|nr:MAG: T9SS type B sorting domain-containing protein [Sphingobacteriales bacterium]
MKRAIYFTVFFCCFICNSYSQALFTFKIPSGQSVCTDTALLQLKVTNSSSTDTLKTVKLTYKLPAGYRYLKSSVTGTSVSESNITKANAPVFSVPNLKPGDSVKLTLKVIADCDIISFINGGGTLKNLARIDYSKGSDSANSSSYSLNVPTLNISKITNQSYVGSPGDTFSRFITFTNTAVGKITGFTFFIVKGKDIQIDSLKGKKYTSSSDTIKVIFNDKDFKTIGNKDNYLNKGETLVLREYVKVNGCSSVGEKFIANWGCNNKICETYSTTAGVVINAVYPNLSVTPGYYQSTCLSKTLDNKQKLTIKNSGTGAAYNVVIDVFQTIYYPGGYYDTVQSRIDEKSLKIKYGSGTASSTSADTFYKTTAKPCLSFSNPKGRFIKIISVLKAGETVELTWDVYSCCTANGYVNTWGYKVDYTEQCKAKNYTTGLLGANYRRYQNFSNYTASTKDLIVNDTVNYTLLSTGYNELFPQGNKARLTYEITLPAGVTVKPSAIKLNNSTGSITWKPFSAAASGSKVTLTYMFPMPTSFDLSSSYLDLPLGVDTSGGKGKCGDIKSIILRVKYLADDSCSSCNQTLAQDTFSVKFNCNNPKRVGLQNLSVNIARTSFGLPDNNDDGKPDASGSLNFTKIATDRVMYGDTFKVDFKGIVRVKGTPSIFHFGIADIKFSEDYFEPIGFEIRIVDSTNKKVYTCDKIPYYEKNGNNYRFFFHYDSLKSRGCSTTIASGYRYRSGDSIQIKVFYKVIVNNYGLKKVRVDNTFFFGANPNPTKLKDYFYIDNFPGSINVVGYYHTYYGYTSGTHTGCKTVDFSQSFYLSIGPCCSNYYGGNIFPNEYRNWSHAKEFKTVLPKGYDYISAMVYYYPTEGTGNYGVYSSTVQLRKKIGDTLIFDIDSLYKPNGGNWYYSDDGYAGTMVVTAKASCEAEPDVYNLVYQYQTYEQDSKLAGDKYFTQPNYAYVQWQRPALTIQAALQTVNTLTDTFSWKVYISNIQQDADVDKLWLGYESAEGKIWIDSVMDDGNSFGHDNGIFKLGKLAGGDTKILKVKSTIKSCRRDSIKLIMGWSCADYPDSVKGYGCPADTLILFAEPKDPGVQIRLVSAPDSIYLCDTAKYTLQVTNTKTGFAKESEVDLVLIPGLKVAKGSSYLEYPIGSKLVKIADPDSINPYLFKFRGTALSARIDSIGLPGVTDTLRNAYRIHTGLITNCEYISGSFIEFAANSYNSCNQQVNLSTTVTPALYLHGAVAPYLGLITFRSSGVNACGKGSELIIKLLNIGNGSTDSTDNIFITLPKGLSLDKTYFKKRKNAPNDNTREEISFNGQTRVSWDLPKGVVSGDSVVFAVWLKPDSSLGCAKMPLFLQSTTKKSLTCVTNNTTCFVRIETGRLLQNIDVKKPVISLDEFYAFAKNNTSGGEALTVNIRLRNAGDTLLPGKGQIVKFYLDNDGNKKLSPGDTQIGTDTIKTKINPKGSIKISKTYNIPGGKNCALIAFWDPTGTNCSCSPTQVYLGKIPLLNAGKDTSVCFGETITIGEDSINGYKYNWSPGNLVADSTKSITTFTGANTGNTTSSHNLVLTTTRKGNCAVKDTVVIRSFPKFTIDPGNEKTICFGSSTTLGGSPTVTGGSGTFTYIWLPKNGLSSSTIANPKATPSATTRYKLTVKQNGCERTDSVLVIVLPVPIADAGDDKNLCEGDTVILGGSTVASGGKSPYSYSWNPSTALSSSTAKNPKASPTSTTTYILTVTDDNSCKGYDTIVVNVNKNPVADAGKDADLCAGDSMKLGGSKSASGGIFPYTYIWKPTVGLKDSTVANPYAKPKTTTTYTLTVTDAKGCKNTSKIKVTVNSLPVAVAGKNREICFGDTTVIGGNPTASGGSGTFTYSWSPKNALSSATVSNPKVYPKTTTTYKLKITDAKGCFVLDSVKITVNSLPIIEAGKNDTICENDTIKLSATSAGNYTYSWSPGKWLKDSTVLNTYIYPSKNTSFILTAKNAKGCITSDTLNIFVRSRKALSPPKLTCVSASDSNKIQINWDTLSNNIEYQKYSLYRINSLGKVSLVTDIKNRKTATYAEASMSDANKSTYAYFLTSWNICGVESKHSDTIATIILKTTKIGDKTLNLSWNAPYQQNQKYALEYNTGSGFKTYDSIYKTNYQIKSCNLNASYRIKAILNNSCTVYSNQSQKILLKDTTAPAQNTLVLATVKDWKQIELQFTKSDSADVKNYKIYRSENGGSFALVASVKGSAKTILYTDGNLATNKNSYSYKILSEDTCGNISTYTKTHTPVLLTAKAGNYEAQLSWKIYQGFTVKRQELQRYENGKWEALKSLNTSDSNYTDKPLTCNITQYYRIRSVSSDSAISSFSDSIIVTPFDTVKPQVPVIKSVSVNPNVSVNITWNKVADADVKNYVIYRKNANSSSWKKIATVGNTNTYTDKTNFVTDSIFVYAVTALDSCAKNESAQSIQHNTILLNVKTKGCEQAAYLDWNAYNNWKDGVKTYKIYRAKDLENELLIDSTTATNWKDTKVDFHNSFTYRIVAQEKNGSEISSSNTYKIKTVDPGTPEIFYATKLNSSADSGRILLKWNIKNQSIYASYQKLFYRTSKDSLYKILADKIPLKQDSFVHENINTRVGYHDYFLQNVDSCDNISDSSTNHTPIDLTVNVGQLVHTLHWSPYLGWPKNTYVVQKWDGKLFYDLDTIPGSDTALRKFPAPCNSDIFYRIKAIGPKGQVSYSDTMGGRAIDTIPPDAPTMKNVSVISGNLVRVDFAGADSLDIYAYAIQRGERGSWTTAGTILYTKPHDDYTFTDKTTTWKNQLCYTVITLDSCLNATSSDTFCTIQLHGLEKNLSNQLSWQPFVGYGIDTYTVEYLNANNWDTLVTVKGADTSNFHAPLPCNVPVSYRVIGTKTGALSTFSDTITLVPYDTIKPQAPFLEYISVLDKQSFEAHWQFSTDKDVKLYELQSRSENGNWVKIDTLDRKKSYILTGKNTLDSTYLFRVVAIDSCADNRSLPSTEHKTIQLKGAPRNLSSLLQWNNYEGFTVKNYVVYSWRNNTWKVLDTISGTQKSYLDTGLQCNVPFVYKVSALADKNGFISYSDTISITPYDTIKPPAPKINYASVLKDGEIALYWNKSVPDVKLYEVSINDGNNWKIIDTLNQQLNYTFKGLNTASKSYCFRVAAIDSCAANKSAYSEIHCPIQLDGKPGNLANNLNWSAYKGFTVNKYYIYEYAQKWFVLDSVDGKTTKFIHTSLACNVPHIYKVAALDNLGKFLSFSDSIKLTPFDTIKPKSPSLKYVTVQANRTIQIAWNWDTKSDVKYFEIWRNKDQESWQKITTVVYDSQFTDANVQPQISNYKYFVIAIDSCNILNRSTPSDTDKIMNVKLVTGGCVPLVRVSWNAYIELPQKTDMYEILRSEDGITFTKVGGTAANITSYLDTLVQAGVAYQYKIKAVDFESSYSSLSDSAQTVPWIFPRADSNQIVYTSIRKTGVSNGEILVKWKQYDFINDTFARGYNLYRSTSPQGPYKKIFTSNNSADTAYIDDQKNTSDSLHFYYVAVYNVCNIDGPKSVVHQPVNLSIDNKNLESGLSWNNYRGANVDYYEIFKSKNGGAYGKIATLSKNDSIFSDTNVLCKQVNRYQVFAHLQNGKISASDIESVTSFDTIPPQRPDIQAVSVQNSHKIIGEISVIYTGNKEKNRSGYRIFTKDKNGNFTFADDQNSTKTDTITYVHEPVNTSLGPLTYYVAALDSCGNISMPSDTHTTVFLQAKAYSMFIELNWSPYSGFKKNFSYKIQRKKANDAWTEIAQVPNNIFSLRDSSAECNIYYAYRILTQEDISGAFSYSNTAGDTAFETELPEPPVIKSASVFSPNTIILSWRKSVSKDESGYHIYRSDDMGIAWNLIAYDVKDSTYIDGGKNTYNIIYQYKISTLDKCGNVSAGYSEPHGTIKLRAKAGNEKVDLNWSAYLGWIPDAYRIFRDGNFLASVPGNILNYTDTNMLCINSYQYKIMAYKLDGDSLISWSNADSAKPYDLNPPEKVYLKTATVSLPNKKVTLYWEASVSRDVQGYKVWRKNGNSGFFEFVDSTISTTYTDSFDAINASHCYYIETYDYCDNKSDWSNPGCIMVLFGESKPGKNTLNWNPYKVWNNGINNYNIYRNDDSSGWRNIAVTGNLNYEDLQFADSTIEKFCYKVEAIENGTGINSFSTVVCLQQEPIVYIPNAFTPELPDGRNDRFAPDGLYIRSYTMQIFNRWGQMVYETKNSRGWDGKYRGEVSPDGIYMYKIMIESFGGEKKFYDGTLMLLR